MFRTDTIEYSLYLLSEYNKIDYLNENISVDSYDWDLLEEYIQRSVHVELLESFKLAKIYPSPNELKHVYEVETLKKLKFEVILNYADPEKSYDLTNIRESAYKLKHDNKLTKEYSDLKNVLKASDGVICMVMFKDSEGSTKLTGKVDRISGLELFRTINEVLKDSFYKSELLGKISCVGMRIDNSEKNRRLPFYKMLHKKYWNIFFPNLFVDEKSENEYNYTLLYFHK